MKTKDKLLIVGVLTFVLVGIGLAIYDKNVCNPEWETIEENLDYIKTENSIVEIKLYESYSDFDINLVNDTVTITDINDIELIRKMINGKYTGTWNRPTASWHIQMKLILDNKRTFEFRVSKINNDKSQDMTHIYFGSKHCGESSPNCSETLGNYLENLTGYRTKGE
jgi:hypothetical protein